MKAIQIRQGKPTFRHLFDLARREPLLILAEDGKEYILSPADDFETEVERLRGSRAFQQFLDRRHGDRTRIPLASIEKKIDAELAREKKA